MSFPEVKKNAIRKYIMEKIKEGDDDFIDKTVDSFGFSRTTAYRYLDDLVKSGKVEKSGNGHYSLKSSVSSFSFCRSEGSLESEEHIFDCTLKPLIGNLPENVRKIWYFAFSEMMNNAIEHSSANNVDCEIITDSFSTTVLIKDNGIGIFNNIQKWFGLDSPEDAIGELFKGRVTTDSANHSGEGIFFTSRILDEFAAVSDGLIFSRNKFEDITVRLSAVEGSEEWNKMSGTIIFMRLSNTSSRNIADVIRQFAVEDEFEFSKTSIPIRDFFNDFPVSRSQAKRLCARLDVFKVVEFDFEGVEDIGQGFADQVFRVWQNMHPEISINAVNTSDNVKFMINHVKRMK